MAQLRLIKVPRQVFFKKLGNPAWSVWETSERQVRKISVQKTLVFFFSPFCERLGDSNFYWELDDLDNFPEVSEFWLGEMFINLSPKS